MQEINKENLYTEDCIRTFTGKYVNVFEPTIDMICIEDIAHALSNQCRFGGHLPNFYSVAEHSILCSKHVPQAHKIAALLHDASEAYLLDIPSPIKKRLTNYKYIENKLMLLIAERYNFQYPLSETIEEVDKIMLAFEWEVLMLGNTQKQLDYDYIPKFNSWEPKYSKDKFLYECNLLGIYK